MLLEHLITPISFTNALTNINSQHSTVGSADSFSGKERLAQQKTDRHGNHGHSQDGAFCKRLTRKFHEANGGRYGAGPQSQGDGAKEGDLLNEGTICSKGRSQKCKQMLKERKKNAKKSRKMRRSWRKEHRLSPVLVEPLSPEMQKGRKDSCHLRQLQTHIYGVD